MYIQIPTEFLSEMINIYNINTRIRLIKSKNGKKLAVVNFYNYRFIK